MRGVAMAMHEPIGTVGIIAPNEAPLLGLISTLAPALAMGNRVILCASEPFPLTATDLIQVLETSDIPAGVVNILTGPHSELAPHLAGHMAIEACWSFGSADVSKAVEVASVGNLKRTWVNNGLQTDWSRDQTKQMLAHATQVKNIWVPYGE
jgi:aldehyde dehydrogenase (NAD+)